MSTTVAADQDLDTDKTIMEVGGSHSRAQHTTLTPNFDRMFSMEQARDVAEEKQGGGGPSFSSSSSSSSSSMGVSQVRKMVKQCLDNGITSTACLLADKLLRMPGAGLADQVLFARCFHTAHEPRRCLAALEHKELLSAHVIADLSDVLSPNKTLGGPSTLAPPASFYDYMQGVLLAAQCLMSLEQYEDCINLLDPLLFVDSNDESVADAAAKVAREVYIYQSTSGRDAAGSDSPSCSVNLVAALYSLAGKCFDLLENRPRAVSYLVAAMRVDPACTEAVEYLTERSLLSKNEQAVLYDTLNVRGWIGREWLDMSYKFLLLDGLTDDMERDLLGTVGNEPEQQSTDIRLSSIALVRLAERLYDNQYPAEAYRLARQAYVMDSFDTKGLLVYIASMVELGLTTELFYLGHELSHGRPKLASSWYAVGCYYWSCKKMELAQKFFQKTVKLDKHFSRAWVALGHVLAAQEESEHAISAFRSASRLLPGDHRPLMYMAKELVRTNYLSLALHLLVGALRIQPHDPALLNEVGVVCLKQDRLDDAIEHLSLAASILQGAGLGEGKGEDGSDTDGSVRCKQCGDEIFSNYATALRRAKRFEDALYWYNLCLTVNPTDACTHASIGFTLHLMNRVGEAIDQYHKALALQPTFSFCSDMLSRAMDDYTASGASGMLGVSGSAMGMMEEGTSAQFGGDRGIGGTPAHLQFDCDSSSNADDSFLQHGTLDSSNSMDT